MRLRPDLERRLADAERAAAETSRGPIVLIDVTKLADAYRDAYWAGNDTVLKALGATPAVAPGQITTVVISLHEGCREGWLASRLQIDQELEETE